MPNLNLFDTSSTGLQPIETKRASEAIYEQIKNMIVSGSLRPGDRLPSERHMMEQLKRSRPTVREALRMLEREGFIRTTAGANGAVVQEMSTRGVEQSLETMLQMSQITLKELAEYRSFNDVYFAEWAAQRRSQEDLDAMEELLKRSEGAIGSYEEFIQLDPEFHGLVSKASKNDVSYIITVVFSRMNVSIMRNKMRLMTPKGRIAMCEKVLYMHQDIFNAIKAQDVGAARNAMSLHMQAFTSDLQMDEPPPIEEEED